MIKRNVNYDNIAQAAAVLKSKGEKPNTSSVAKMLGIRGLTGTIAKYLEAWYENQKEYQSTNYLPSLEKDLQEYETSLLQNHYQLEHSLSLMRATLESTADGIALLDRAGKIVDWNQKFIEMWQLSAGFLEKNSKPFYFIDLLDQMKDKEILIAEILSLNKHPQHKSSTGEIQFKDGQVFEYYSQPQKINGRVVGSVWSFRDITRQKRKEEVLGLQEHALEASDHGVFIINARSSQYPIIYVNQAFQRITGFNKSEIIGNSIKLLEGKFKDLSSTQKVSNALKNLTELKLETRHYKKNGAIFWNELYLAPVADNQGDVFYFVGIINDVTNRHLVEEELMQQATHDPLTHLPNRLLLMDRVNQGVAHTKRHKTPLALLFIDLDRFKFINDSVGHMIGDMLLQEVARRLSRTVRESDTVARLGGDEFVIMLTSLKSREEASTLANTILMALAEPYYIHNHYLNLTASIGMSFYGTDGKYFEQLIKNADIAMYCAKESGKNNIKEYQEEMNKKIIHRLTLEKELQEAILKEELSLVYQPQFDLEKNQIFSVETLLRWRNSKLGEVPSLEFISLAEKNGMMRDIGRWILKKASVQIQYWHQLGFNDLKLAVNLSREQFTDPNLLEILHSTLREINFPPYCLNLELAENILIEDMNKTLDTLEQIKNLGLTITVDNFGAGYSNLSYLKKLPIDILKIDKHFIANIEVSEDDITLIKAIINLAHSLNLKAMAEGVETEKQKKFLIKHHCDFIQGYYISHPENAEAITKLLTQKKPL